MTKLLSDTTQTSSANNALQQQQSALPNIQRIKAEYPEFTNFSAKFNPDNWEKGARQPTKCVSCNSPTLTDINLAYGEGHSVAWLMAQLTVFQEKLNVPNKMTAYEIETCAQTIHDHFHHLKATELMLFFARLLGGMYPVDWHGYVTPTKIVSALREDFMPWRNDLLYQIEKEEEVKRRESALHDPKAITYEEWCRLRGKDPNENPLSQIKTKEV